MKLTSNNPRITDVEITDTLDHLSYFVDGHLIEVDGEFDFFGCNAQGEYEGLREIALVRDPRCYDTDGSLNNMCEELPDGGVIEEIYFEARF